LARRLSRHGLPLSGGLVAAVFAQSAAAAPVPAPLVVSTMNAARLVAAGKSASITSAQVAALTTGVLKTMFLNKLRNVVTVLLGVAIVGAGMIALAHNALAAKQGQGKAGLSAHPPGAAKEPAPMSEPLWKKEFRAKYGLKDGEHVKRIAEPYPPCRSDYMAEQSAMAANQIPYDDYFSVFGWKGDWAPPALGRHALPVKPDVGVGLGHLIDMVAGTPRTRVQCPADLLEEKVTGDFVVRDGATADQIMAQLQPILNRDCKLAVTFKFKEADEDVLLLSGKYAAKPLEGRGRNEIEIFATHLLDRDTGGGGSGGFDAFLAALERHIGKPVAADNIEGRPKMVSWHFNVRSPRLVDPGKGIDTFAEDTDAPAVLGNIAAQTGLSVKTEKRKMRVMVVQRAKADREP
jgi:hypothetical protein